MSIQWGRVLLAAFLMELVLFAIAIPLFLSGAETGTMAILGRPRIEGCWRRRRWNGPGAASERNESSHRRPLIHRGPVPGLISARKIATICL